MIEAKMRSLLLRYISVLQDIEQFKRINKLRAAKAFGFETERLRLHELIAIKLEELHDMHGIYNNLKHILSNLNIACNYGGGDTLERMATNLEKLLYSQEARQFLSGKLYKLNTPYGIIINGDLINSMNVTGGEDA